MIFSFSLALHQTVAWAQQPDGNRDRPDSGPLVVIVEGGLPLDEDQLRESIAEELDVLVIPLSHPEARQSRGTLTIARNTDGAVLFIFRHHSGREVWRSIELGPTLEETHRSAVLLAGNLVRDQTSQLIDIVTYESPTFDRSEGSGDSEEDTSTVDSSTLDPTQASGATHVEPLPSRRHSWARDAAEARALSYSDAWAFEAHVVGAFAENLTTLRALVRASRRWHALALSISESSGRLSMCTWSECVTLGQHTLTLDFAGRLRAGPLIAELGLGFGARLHRLNGQRGSTLVYSPLGRLDVDFVIPVAHGVDLIAGTSFATTFYTVHIPAFYSDISLSTWEITLNMGIRLHL